MPRNRLTYAVQLRGICDAIVNPWFLHRKRRIFTPSEWYARSIRIGFKKCQKGFRKASLGLFCKLVPKFSNLVYAFFGEKL